MLTDYPLTKTHRLRLAHAFRQVERVDLSIDCVIEGQMGQAYVDDSAQPRVFVIRTGPFAYLAGEVAGPAADVALRSVTGGLLMPSAPGWAEAALAMYRDRLFAIDRYSLSPEALSSDYLRRLASASHFADRVTGIDEKVAASVWGRDHFIDLSAYESVADFLERGIGFCVTQGEHILGAALAGLVCSRGIEISLYVEADYRRQGMATALSAYLLTWCLERGLEPHWDAANPESCELAIKLGYRPMGSYTAYYVKP